MVGRKEIPYFLQRTDLVGVEIGVQHGVFSMYLLESGLFKKLYSIDPYPVKIPGVFQNGEQYYCNDSNETYEIAVQNLSQYEESELIRKYSNVAVFDFKDASLDFIFIDGDHTYEGVMNDLTLWWPKLKVGGIMSGHDYWDMEMDCGDNIISTFKVKSAVDDFAKEHNIKVQTVKEESLEDWYSWFFLK
jgi:hypothetical protein